VDHGGELAPIGRVDLRQLVVRDRRIAQQVEHVLLGLGEVSHQRCLTGSRGPSGGSAQPGHGRVDGGRLASLAGTGRAWPHSSRRT
jgi:hypothetical protein